MQTRLLSAQSPVDLDEAAAVLRRGGLVAFPTETVYGLGALALDPLAVRGIFSAKGRPASNPVIIHVLGEDDARALVTHWPMAAATLASSFWPGPLTLVLPRAPRVPDECTAGGDTVGVRAPSHPAARALLERVGAPLAAPSANRAEHVSPTTAAHVLRDLNGRIDLVLDGGRCAFGIESTVVALDRAEPRLLRAGAIPRAAIEELIGPLSDGLSAGPAQSPGQHKRHYAPAGVVRLASRARLAEVAASLQGRVGALLHGGEAPAAAAVVRLPEDAAGYARELYASLRELEDAACAAIVIEEVPETPEWDAVRDRLQRAAAQ
ncbi:MAG TPA: L-threonylcarbamoyladenylate synthase [Myxococcales bacterium]|jgi:L-threonylcarbamoyladenylate synthase|nr:L-threonylcarbamoyladenylate synthase [Myxococcales bacterium]